MRQRLVSLLGAVLLVILGTSPATARQEATPVTGFAGLGLPTLDVTATADAYEGIPESLEAGRYLVTITVAADTEFGGGIAFVRPGVVTAEEFLAALAGPPDEAGAGATPMAEAEATPAAAGLPPFILDAT
ncbi:MAG: hypothetical protein QOG89_3642, partial [Thermomicrobiales bacterium]|nr:hypothetical protein [Thermomicrobiales bacterium]